MCYEWGENGFYFGKEKVVFIDYFVIKKVIEDLLLGKFFFGLFGGEFLLYFYIGEVIKLIWEGGCKVDIFINGILIEKKVEMLVES